MLGKFLKILFDIKSPKRGLISFTGFVLLVALILSFAVSYHLAHSHKLLIYSVEKVKSELTLAHLQKSDKLFSDYFDDDTTIANSKKHLVHILKSKNWDDAFIPVISAKQIAEIESILKKITVFDSLVHQNLNLNLEEKHNTLFISLIEDINTLQNEMNVTYNFQDKASQTVYIIILILFLVYIMAAIYVINKHTKIRNVLIAQQNRLTHTIKSIEKNINIKIGDDYYISLALELNKQFKADYILIANYNKKEHTSTSLVYLNKQRVLENITYDLAHTPCEIALIKGYVFYGSNLTKTFNKDKYLKDNNIESYLGITIRNESNQVVGHLLAMYCKPIIGEEHYKLLMQFFADKIGKEFIRNRLLGELNVKKKELQKSQEIAQLGSYVIDFKTGQINFSYIAGRIIGAKQKGSFKLISWQEMIHPDDLLRYQKETTKNIKNKRNIDLEYRIFTKDKNELKWVHCVSQLNYKDGKPDAITGVIQDITQRKEAEEKLKQSDAILSRLNTLVLVNDGNSNMIYVSPSIKQILVYEPEELLGQGWWDLTYKTAAEAKKVREAVKNYLYHKGPKTQRVSYRKIKTKTGSYKHIEWYVSKGVGNTYINIGVDITSRYREEQIKKIIFDISKYAHSNPKLKDLLPFIKDSLNTVIDTTNFYIALNDAVFNKFNLNFIVGEDADLQGKSFSLEKSITGYALKKKQTQLITDVQFEILKSKGEVTLIGQAAKIWLGVPLIDDDKAIGIMTVQSFTDKKAYSQKDVALLELVAVSISSVIKRSQDLEKINLLNMALIQSPASIIITDKAGCIEYVNPTFTKLSGYSSEEAIGQNPRFLKSGNQPDAYYKNLWDTITRGKTWQGEFVNERLDNSKYLVSVNISPVKDTSGEITHFIGIQEDITEKRQLERDYIHAFIEAQEEEKEHFGEELHDGISQILAAEAMYIEILIRQNKDRLDDKAKYLYKVKELNLSAIDDARNISHGLMSKQLKEQGLIKAVAHICDNFSKSKDINFKFTCKNLIETDISKEIKTNLFRVAQEISTNIVRHSLAKKAFTSFEKLPNNRLKLRIKDDGVGIDLDKIKKDKKGAGLKNIERRITLLGGKINIESQANKGTCFTIEVPLERIQ